MRFSLERILENEKSGGIALILCTLFSLLMANMLLGETYVDFWQTNIGGLSIELWINDLLMAIFFLTVGLELVREFKIGEFADKKNALLPLAAAIGGMLIPATFYTFFNNGLPTQSGFGIPMATDIAFALGILSLLGNRVPPALKVFLMALAVLDDLGAIIIIAIFYTKGLNLWFLIAALAIFLFLLILKKKRVKSLTPFYIGGAILWFFMFKSGVHATIAGVLFAFTIPFGEGSAGRSPSLILLHKLHVPVTFLILPLFALANTAIPIASNWYAMLAEALPYGIMTGLTIGKPIGIVLACALMVVMKLCNLPTGVDWKILIGTGCLGGIGFTMSIFISLLAFNDPTFVNEAKIAVLLSSFFAAIIGFTLLHFCLPKNEVAMYQQNHD